MLCVISSMSQLNIEQLMAVYAEGNVENGKANFPNFSHDEQIKMAERDFVDYLRQDFFQQKDAAYYVWVIDGIYRAALRLEPYKDGLLLEALETAPDHRRKGYAYNLLREALDCHKNTTVKRLYSHVSKRNIPSLKIHEKCGFYLLKESAILIDGTVTQNSCTMCYDL